MSKTKTIFTMNKTKTSLVVAAVIATGFVCGAANAEDPSHTFIDRLSGKPFRAEGAVPTTTIEFKSGAGLYRQGVGRRAIGRRTRWAWYDVDHDRHVAGVH